MIVMKVVLAMTAMAPQFAYIMNRNFYCIRAQVEHLDMWMNPSHQVGLSDVSWGSKQSNVVYDCGLLLSLVILHKYLGHGNKINSFWSGIIQNIHAGRLI